MKFFTNRSIVQKIVIVILTILLLTFSVPKPVNAVSNILLSPIITLSTSLLDSIQHLLEWAMLGETTNFMRDIDDPYYNRASDDNKSYTVTLGAGEIDGSLWGRDDVNVPVIQYTPEEIFSNRVPMLDVNFINPSVLTGDPDVDDTRNTAKVLQPIIASWYVAIRTLALVGLLSVLVYLGIRMLLTSVAADKAKYKKMIMDWVVAICLLFALHYIMSFALTMSEVVTSMIANPNGGSISVYFDGGNFSGNLMSYVRFMIQSTDTMTGLGFFFLYLMLIIYSIRFTWVYLKRVVNMAFLTLIAPLVALSYPIDKVSDGKAQAFDLWIKEFTFNALIQPLHLLLYMVLLGSATQLAAINPLYAIVCLGFILAGEKLLKQMFGFNKASGGTLGSLAGAMGVSALANKALMSLGRGPHGGKGGPPGKVRTNDQYKREGIDQGANKGFNSFNKEGNQGLDELEVAQGGRSQLPKGNSGAGNRETLDDLEQQRAELYNQGYTDDEIQAIQAGNFEQYGVDTSGSPNPAMTEEALQELNSEEDPKFFETVGNDIKNFGGRIGYGLGQAKDFITDGERVKGALSNVGKGVIKGVRRNAIAAWKSTPTVAYKALRGTAKTASRVALGAALGATAGVIGATMGDGEKALGMAGAGFAVGAGSGGKLFEGTAGKIARDKSIRDSYNAGKYGSAIDARNAKADKAYLKSDAHKEEYEKYFKTGKNQMSKADYDKAVREYRQVGITDTKTIRNALKLEQQYKEKNGGSEKDIRGKVQNIVQTYDNVDKKAVYGDERATAAALKNIEGQLSNVSDAKQKRAVANEILQGYRDWYNI